MPQLVSISDSHQHITLKWPKSPNGLQYELLWNEGNLKNATKLIVRGKLNQYKVPVPLGEAEYRFSVKAINLCGQSSPSEELLVSLKTVQRMSPLVTIASDCMVKFEWVAPRHHEQNNIEEYDVEVKMKNGF